MRKGILHIVQVIGVKPQHSWCKALLVSTSNKIPSEWVTAERTGNRMLFGSLWFSHAGLLSSHADSEVSQQWSEA